MKKLAVVFPGIGYSAERPLLYFARKLAEKEGYEALSLEFSDFPKGIRGDREKMDACVRLALAQTEVQLSAVDPAAYDAVVFIAKSIGTAAATHYAAELATPPSLVLYTPVEATFEIRTKGEGIAFLGENDPWSDTSLVQRLAAESGIPLLMYDRCNHSLETGDVAEDIRILGDVMEKTGDFLRR